MKLNIPFFPFAVLVPLRDLVPNADGLGELAAIGISLGLIIISDCVGASIVS